MLVIRCLNSIISLADRTKENPTQSTPCSKATLRSFLSFSVRLEVEILVLGKLTPFLEYKTPPAITLVLMISLPFVSVTFK